jgi:hypothetical protein
MPSETRKQAVAMMLAAKGKGNIGIPPSVGQEFHKADKKTGILRKKKAKPNA